MSLTSSEQYLLELVNRGRLDPLSEASRYGIDLNQGLSPGTISSAPKQVLAPDALLANAATDHSLWMLDHNTFSHTGAGGSNPGQRMADAGYTFSGSWTWGENLALRYGSSSIDSAAAVESHHEGLFHSSGHRVNQMKDSFREIGISQELGNYNGYNASMVTEKFAKSGSAHFVTGVAYNDSDNDVFYDPGEGQGNVTFTAASGASETTSSAGGYAIGVAPSGATTMTLNWGTKTVQATVDTSGGNAKLDFVDGSRLLSDQDLTLLSGKADAELIGIESSDLTGNNYANMLLGNDAGNRIEGGAGTDMLVGRGGNDVILGEEGADKLAGGDGNDSLYGGSRSDELMGHAGDDMLDGGAGFDTLYGGSDNDHLMGGASADSLYGGGQNDVVAGNGGRDYLNGGAGRDVLIGGAGHDTLEGGAGADTFCFGGRFGTDQIIDWTNGQDILDVRALAELSSFADVSARAQVLGSDVSINLDTGDRIQLLNTDIALLDGSDFWF